MEFGTSGMLNEGIELQLEVPALGLVGDRAVFEVD
jgi:hypothetical protein